MALQLNTGCSEDNIQIFKYFQRKPQLFQALKVFDGKSRTTIDWVLKYNWLMSSVRTNEGQTERNKDLVRICSEKIIVSFHTELKGNVKLKLVLKILLNYWSCCCYHDNTGCLLTLLSRNWSCYVERGLGQREIN